MNDVPSPSPFRALIVDDEQMLRYLLVTALTKEGFVCETAENGEDAWNRLDDVGRPYQLLVTDLLMPVRHGHSLAVEVLTMEQRPVVVILTGVMEPRIAKDLMARGIDDIVFKPTPFRPFAAKMRALVDRRRHDVAQLDDCREGASAVSSVTDEEHALRYQPHSSSPSACEIAATIAALALDPECDLRDLARHVLRAPTLAVDVLKAANSSLLNLGGPTITEVERAVVRLGCKRVGELLTVAAGGNP